ncbi:hypothetical protein CCR75_007218 [Bremia lactucae]|uniref:Uncharacterized protein n=1 Tax=Bremia lactucae TaxID=4779 RepID=A0A976FF11_BRELC|nr:hypothetical protein CCR75_007218 [Bremia lactucae]
MNFDQAQRLLADLVAKCEAAHIHLPEDPLEARAEAVEAIIHSAQKGMPNLEDAQDQLTKKFGLQLTWKQRLRDEEDKRRLRRSSRPKNENDQNYKSKIAKGSEMDTYKRLTPSQGQNNAAKENSKKVKLSHDSTLSGTSGEAAEKQLQTAALEGRENLVTDDDSSVESGQSGAVLSDLEDLDESNDEGAPSSI